MEHQNKQDFFDALEKRTGDTEQDLIRMMSMLNSPKCNTPPKVIYLPDRSHE